MNEIIIDDKKYISSKQAAVVTGYAKDYVGQLCREGRVPARLVGRSWYVLETAIKDHRFGTQSAPSEKSSAKEDIHSDAGKETSAGPERFPRYESADTPTLPSINLLKKIEPSKEYTNEPTVHASEKPYSTKDSVTSRTLQESWNEWFINVQSDELELPVGEDSETTDVTPETHTEDPITHEAALEHGEVSIPMHEIRNSLPSKAYMPTTNLSPRRNTTVPNIDRPQKEVIRTLKQVTGPRTKGGYRALRLLALLIGLFAIIFTALSSGYLDEYMNSISQEGHIPGVTIYQR